MTSRPVRIARTRNAGARAGVARCAPAPQPPHGGWPARGPADRMLLLNTAAYPTLLRYRHAQLGRLCVPGCNSHVAETLQLMKVGFDTGCFHGLDPAAVCRMYEQIAGWPTMGARVAKAYGPLLAGARDPRLGLGGALPQMHRNLLWCTVPDVVHCSCGRDTHCRPRERKRDCAPVGDSIATIERFAIWHPFLAHLPLAYVLQDGCERPGLIPWDARRAHRGVRRRQRPVALRSRVRRPRSGRSAAWAAGALWPHLEPVEDPLRPVDRRDVV